MYKKRKKCQTYEEKKQTHNKPRNEQKTKYATLLKQAIYKKYKTQKPQKTYKTCKNVNMQKIKKK